MKKTNMHLLQYNPLHPVVLETSFENLDPYEVDTELELATKCDSDSEYDSDFMILSDRDRSCRLCGVPGCPYCADCSCTDCEDNVESEEEAA